MPGGTPKNLFGGVAGLGVLVGALMLGNSALFNVDGGHRAIKYTRVGGVRQEIYNEGIYKLCLSNGNTNSF